MTDGPNKPGEKAGGGRRSPQPSTQAQTQPAGASAASAAEGRGGESPLVQTLVDQLKRIAGAQEQQLQRGRPVATLDHGQLRIALHYGALRNALGNFGRHGETSVAILSPAPELVRGGGPLRFDGPVEGAAEVAGYAADGRFLQRFPFEVTVDDVNQDIRTVEIEDDRKTPFLLGVVNVVDSSTY